MFALLRLSDAFSEFWPELADSVGTEIVPVGDLAGLPPMAGRSGVVISAGGVEQMAVRALGTLGAGQRAVVVGAETDYRLAQLLIQAGAERYFVLPADLLALRAWIVERLEEGRASASAAEMAARQSVQHAFARVIGRSDPFRAALERARKIVPLGNTSVLITGETGTGKEVLAQAIHYSGPRSAHPFVEVNCAALPTHLLESELFGHEKGAFTDARSAKPGLFEIANGGTLFLDEIGDLPLELQAKLLKVLDSREVRRVGGLKPTAVDVRVMAATHQDLGSKVRLGSFREDLFYRLNVFRVHLPPLRERGRDVVLLAECFLDRFSREYGIPRPQLTPEVESTLLRQRWPGNVRELKNAVERALALSGGVLHPSDFLPDDLPAPAGAASGVIPFPASLEEISRAAAVAAVTHCGGNKSEAARILRVTRKRLYALLEGASTLLPEPSTWPPRR